MAELLCPSWLLPPTASRKLWTARAVDFSSGLWLRVYHCADGVCVRVGRDTLSTCLPSDPPSRYNVLCRMVDEILWQHTGSGLVENHWLWRVDVSRISTEAMSVKLSLCPPTTTRKVVVGGCSWPLARCFHWRERLYPPFLWAWVHGYCVGWREDQPTLTTTNQHKILAHYSHSEVPILIFW